ncbi:MAG: amidohydrolase family protein [Pseudomonadota bacterium]
MNEITVFTARRFITMNPSNPSATAVAVRDGRILEVGSMETIQPWLESGPHRIDERFADCVVLPGLIDPHLHPSMAAVLLPMHFITAMEWRLPWGVVAPVTTHDGFMQRALELHESLQDPDEPLFLWGYHQFWHGRVMRAELNRVSNSRPIVSWQRSFHELALNDAAFGWLELDEQRLSNAHQVDVANGRFYERGKDFLSAKLNQYLLAPERFKAGLRRLRDVVHLGGHTTIADMAVPIFDLDMEWDALVEVLDNEQTPFRVEMIAHGLRAARGSPDVHAMVAAVDALQARNRKRLRFSDHVKFFADGAFFSQLAQMEAPGYIDGHHGEWMMPLEELEERTRAFWNAGYKIHVHVTGDMGLSFVVDLLEKLQWERPRFNHGFTIEHFGFSTPEQVQRLHALGANVSANVYYLYELSDAYARQGIGHERAHAMARLGSCERIGMRAAVHSDFTMAPAVPLFSAWIAANRLNCEGQVVGPHERLSLDAALRAITIDAAHIIGRADEIGSLRAGKLADFTVVDADPYEVGPERLRELVVLATVLEGAVYPVTQPDPPP